jgi:hypothetical protein
LVFSGCHYLASNASKDALRYADNSCRTLVAPNAAFRIIPHQGIFRSVPQGLNLFTVESPSGDELMAASSADVGPVYILCL